MEKKVVIFNGETYVRNPKIRYYFKHTTKNSERKCAKQLHRAVWEYYRGEIPDGYHIHHVDGNVDNNDISNLECIQAREHLSQHAKKNNENPEYRRKNIESLLSANEKAKAWHKTEAGRKFHREHANDSICKANKKIYEKKCEFCGKSYTGTKQQRYCCQSCEEKARRRRIGLKFEPCERVCPACGKEFTAHNVMHKFCSAKCKQRFYASIQSDS